METSVETGSDVDAHNVARTGMALLNLQDLDETDLESIKGDTVGDTVYSAKWIIETLMSLSKIYDNPWTETLESSLCMLWDMTAEKDVVDFLMAHDFLSIAEFTLEAPVEPRLTEIILGIIGNMCCQPAVLKAVSEANKLLSSIFGKLSTDDPVTLVQVVRLLQAAVWDVERNAGTKWLQHLRDCEYLGDAISFILQSSTNDDLLIAALDLVQSISVVRTADENCLLTDLFKVDRLVPALFESFAQLVPKRDEGHSRTVLKVIENWLTIISSVLQSEFRIFVLNDTNDEYSKRIVDVISRILQPYEDPGNMRPLDARVALCIHECIETVFWFQRNKFHPESRIVRTVVMIMHGLRLAMEEESGMDRTTDTDETIAELRKHLERYWLETLDAYSEAELLEVVLMCENDVKKCLVEVTMEYSKECRDPVDKLRRVHSLANSGNYV